MAWGGQEEEVRLKPGTIKHCALMVLKEAGPDGMSIDQVMDRVRAAGLRTWDQTSKRIVQFVSALSNTPLPPLPLFSCLIPNATSNMSLGHPGMARKRMQGCVPAPYAPLLTAGRAVCQQL